MDISAAGKLLLVSRSIFNKTFFSLIGFYQKQKTLKTIVKEKLSRKRI